MDRLIENIKLYTPLNEQEIRLLLNAVEKKVYQKNEQIFTEGKTSDEIYFVTKGCVRLFYNMDGIDKTAFFYTKGQFIIPQGANSWLSIFSGIFMTVTLYQTCCPCKHSNP